MDKITKICIGIPHTGLFHWQTISAILGLKAPKKTNLLFHLIGSCLVYDAREKIIEFAKNNDCKYILFLDSDMVPPSDIITKMYNILENNENIDLISGMAFKRTPPFQPCWYTSLEYDINTFQPKLSSPYKWNKGAGLMEIAGVGLACSMIKVNLFDKMNKPYFFPLPNLGEDLTFCLKAKKEAKATLVVDLTIDVGHCSVLPINEDHYRSCLEEYEKNNDSKNIFIDAEKEIDNKQIGKIL